MVLLSKPLTDEEKDFAQRRLSEMVVFAVAVQNIQSFVDMQLISDCTGNDPARTSTLLAATSSAGGLVEFLLNPVLGNMTDSFGRKWVYYVGPAVSGVAMSLAVMLTEGKNLPVLIVHKTLCWSLMSMSCSFISPITISDMYSGPELGIRVAKLFGAVGISIMLAAPLGAAVLGRFGRMAVFKLRLALAALQLFYVHRFVPETLTAEKQRPFSGSGVNPFAFLRLFSGTRTLRILMVTLFACCMAEGKNLVPLRQSWQNGPPLAWPLWKQSLLSVFQGSAGFVSNTFVVPRLMKSRGPRGFTSTTTRLNVLGFLVMSLPHDVAYWLGNLIHGPGFNNTNAAALKAMATDHAVANGFARGEYGGMYSSVRTFSMIVAPLIFGYAYTGTAPTAARPGRFAPLPWVLVALLGALLPELLHMSLSDADLRVPEPPADTSKEKDSKKSN